MTGTERAARSLRSRRFDATVIAVGLFIGAMSVVTLPIGQQVQPIMLLGVPLIAVMSSFPLLLDRRAGGIEVGFESCVLVLVAVAGDVRHALAVWSLGTLLAQVITDKRRMVKAFNIGLGSLAGFLALLTMRAISPLDETSPRELLAVAAGCAVYFTIDYVLSGVSVALEENDSVKETLAEPSALVALAVFVAIDSLGYLAALVVRALPPWASLLLAVPLTTILVAARALSRGTEHQRRLSVLFAAAADAQSLPDRVAVSQRLVHHAHDLLRQQRVELRPEPPESDEVGALVRTPEGDRWLVGPARNRARASVTADRQALEALAAVAEEAYGRLELVEEMSRLARTDALTGLANRVLFQDRVEHATRQHRRRGERLAVLFCDLDGFKAVNDRFGHSAGDELLREVARRILGCVREVDTVARLGGDEFAVLLEDVADRADAEVVCERILEALRPGVTVAGRTVTIATSIGVAVSGPDDDATALLRDADMAMYRAKANGKSRWEIYQPELREESLRLRDTLEELRAAVTENQLVLHYQPVVDLATGRRVAVEALIRWQRGDELVGPDHFIGLAEDSGLIVSVGRWVLERVAADAPRLAALDLPLGVSVNVSAHQLRHAGILDAVGAACAALAPSRLTLEMTENVLIGDDVETVGALHALDRLGARLAIDDFGTGFSSIGYLQHLPVTLLKVDRRFSVDVGSDHRAEALLRSMLLMGEALGLGVVVEGIETEHQLAAVRELGVRWCQGYLLGRPAPLDELIATSPVVRLSEAASTLQG